VKGDERFTVIFQSRRINCTRESMNALLMLMLCNSGRKGFVSGRRDPDEKAVGMQQKDLAGALIMTVMAPGKGSI